MVTRLNGGDLVIMYIDTKSLRCTPETSTILDASYTTYREMSHARNGEREIGNRAYREHPLSSCRDLAFSGS